MIIKPSGLRKREKEKENKRQDWKLTSSLCVTNAYDKIYSNKKTKKQTTDN